MGTRGFFGLLVVTALLGSLFSCEIIPIENENFEEKLKGTWVNNRGGVFIFDNNNWEYSEGIPIYKGTFTVNNNLMTQKVTHIYSGNDFINYLNLHSLELNKWYTVTEIKTIIGNDLFNYLASENGLDPITFLIDPIPYSIDGFSLYYGLSIYSKEHYISKLDLNIGHFTDQGENASDWNTGSSLKMKSFFSGPIKKSSKYIVNISGILDNDVESLGVYFLQHNPPKGEWAWEWLGGSERFFIPKGAFRRSFTVNIYFDADTQKEAFLSFNTNYEIPPENIVSDTCMASIKDFTISIIEK